MRDYRRLWREAYSFQDRHKGQTSQDWPAVDADMRATLHRNGDDLFLAALLASVFEELERESRQP